MGVPLIDLLICHSWSFVEIRLHCSDDKKPDFRKYFLSVFIHLYGFQICIGAPRL
jgi:hypothetical protein